LLYGDRERRVEVKIKNGSILDDAEWSTNIFLGF
jgi:hypothetical protein